ncbi:hypothetical protein RJT34_23179 [Clitoria ternatea]|uniref:Uncharacterized protein n=1 Tax=Clitoria ternatea TaxID=43366 RepID=A0AAN9IGY7_CLITE
MSSCSQSEMLVTCAGFFEQNILLSFLGLGCWCSKVSIYSLIQNSSRKISDVESNFLVTRERNSVRLVDPLLLDNAVTSVAPSFPGEVVPEEKGLFDGSDAGGLDSEGVVNKGVIRGEDGLRGVIRGRREEEGGVVGEGGERKERRMEKVRRSKK